MEYYIRMSLRQWLALFAFYAMYVLLGTSIFYTIEHNSETERIAFALKERIEINELLTAYTSPDDVDIQNKILAQVTDYCGRKVTNHTLDEFVDPHKWNFFHALYFSLTTCTTVGRIVLCFYALFGIPISCFAIASVAHFFAEAYYRLYKQYTEYQHANTKNYVPPAVGFVGKICLYLTPGLVFFIFLPAILFCYFEDWDYITAVYYAFVTLSTVGYGDLVPTYQAHQEREFHFYFLIYEIFIILWNIAGLGYVLMLINFVAKAMKSKRVANWEHKISKNIRATEHLVRQEVSKDLNFLRRLLNEINFMKVKPVYTDDDSEKPNQSLKRSSTCPELSMYHYKTTPRTSRNRSCSVAHAVRKGSKTSTTTLNKTQSDGDLHLIDRKRTFGNSTKNYGNGDLITRVVSALGSIRQFDEVGRSSSEFGVNGFSDSQILSTERRFSDWSVNRSDAGFHASRINSLNGLNQLTWNGSSFNATTASQLMDSKDATRASRPVAFSRSVSLNMPEDDNNLQSIVNREVINRMLNKTNSVKSRMISDPGKRHSVVYPEMDRKKAKRGSIMSLPREYMSATSKGRDSIVSIFDTPVNASKSDLLETTSIADLIRALEIVRTSSQKEDGSAKDPPKMKNHLSQIMNTRRGSLRPIPGYTTIFSSDNIAPNRKISSQSTPDSSLLSRDLSLRPHCYPTPQYTTAVISKPTIQRYTERSTNTSSEGANPSTLLQKKLPLGPSPLAQENFKMTGSMKRKN